MQTELPDDTAIYRSVRWYVNQKSQCLKNSMARIFEIKFSPILNCRKRTCSLTRTEELLRSNLIAAFKQQEDATSSMYSEVKHMFDRNLKAAIISSANTASFSHNRHATSNISVKLSWKMHSIRGAFDSISIWFINYTMEHQQKCLL